MEWLQEMGVREESVQAAIAITDAYLQELVMYVGSSQDMQKAVIFSQPLQFVMPILQPQYLKILLQEKLHSVSNALKLVWSLILYMY